MSISPVSNSSPVAKPEDTVKADQPSLASAATLLHIVDALNTHSSSARTHEKGQQSTGNATLLPIQHRTPVTVVALPIIHSGNENNENFLALREDISNRLP